MTAASLSSTAPITATSSLRILALNWRCLRHPDAGGAEVNLFEQARRWACAGNQVTILCADPGRDRAPDRDEVQGGVRIRRMGGRFSIYLFAALYLLRHGKDFDRILDVANGIPFFAPLFTKRPVTLLVHHVCGRQWSTELPFPAAALGHFLEQQCMPLVYRYRPVVAVSPTTREALTTMGLPPENIRVIYNGMAAPVDSAVDAPDSPSRPGARGVVYVGRLKRYKRLDRLVRTVARLREEFPDVHLHIAGDGDARPEIEALVRRLDLGESVTLYGSVDEATKAGLLRRATVFATPSMHEGWGLTVIEANCHGCPAVAYDVPGLRAAIRHGETGLLARDDDAFCDAIAHFLREDVDRAQYVANARSWAAQFSWDSCATQTLDVLRTGHVQLSSASALDTAGPADAWSPLAVAASSGASLAAAVRLLSFCARLLCSVPLAVLLAGRHRSG